MLSDLDWSRHHPLFVSSSASHPAGPHGRHAQKNGKSGPPLLGAGGFDTICTAVLVCCDSSTTCRLCRLDPSAVSFGLFGLLHSSYSKLWKEAGVKMEMKRRLSKLFYMLKQSHLVRFFLLIAVFCVHQLTAISETYNFIRYPYPYHIIYLICTNLSHSSSINYCSITTIYAFVTLQ